MSDAERAILGAVVLDNAHVSTAIDLLRPEFFTGPHRPIFKAVSRLADADKPVDLTTLRDELEGMGDLAAVGGPLYLASLIDGVPKSKDITPWTTILRERALRKYAGDLGRKLTTEAADGDVTTDVLIDRHLTSIQKLMESFETGNTTHISQVLKASMKALEDFLASKHGMTGVPTSLPRLDATTCGFQPGTLVTIAARPGNGKTTLLAQMAACAATAGFKGLVFSMEMEPYQIAQRMLLADAEVDRWQLKVASDDIKWGRISKSYGRLSAVPLWFDGREAPSLAQIRAASARHKAKYGLDFVMVDYLQRIPVDPKLENWIGVGENAKGLKTLARQLHVPVIAACQLGRGADGESEPTFKDLAQSGVIERESDIVAWLHPTTAMTLDYPEVSLILAKHRAGATMRVQLSFEKEHTKFVEMASSAPPKPSAEVKNWRGEQ